MSASPTSKQIAIVGAGICGLCTALGLAKQGHKVTVYERDDPLPDGGPDEIFFRMAQTRGVSISPSPRLSGGHEQSADRTISGPY